MALQVEMVVDGVVDGQKLLHRAGRLEPSHSSFSLTCWLVGNFRPIV